MRNVKEHLSLRTVIMSVLFLFYYAGIATLVLIIYFANPEKIASSYEYSLTIGFIIAGALSGFLLFILSVPRIEAHWKWYWRRANWKALGYISIYSSMNFLLAVIPFFILRFANIIHQINPAVFIFHLIILVGYITSRRFAGLDYEGDKSCVN